MAEQYYLRARYYNPVIGRFIQEDPYRGDGLNLYAYCANNPVRYFDPSGYSGNLNCPGVGFEGSGNKIIEGFSEAELKIIYEAKYILNSPEFDKIRNAYEMGEGVTVNINGRIIQYEPGLNASGMTMFGEDGFLIGNEAFKSSDEISQTLLHELHRLNTTQSASGVTGDLDTNETQAAFYFAQKALEALKQ